MINEMMEFYTKFFDNIKVMIDKVLGEVLMSEGYNQFTRVLSNYMFDMKDYNEKNMEKMLDMFRISSKRDMDEIGDDIADLRRNLRDIKNKLNALEKQKSK